MPPNHREQTNLKLSVIIVNWNVKGLLEECLESLHAETALKSRDYEVLVVDNHSSDGSTQMVRNRYPDVRLIVNQENIGFARANNQALGLCRGEYLLLLNPDTVVRPGAVDRILEYAQAHPDAGIIGCRLLNMDGSLQRWTGGLFPSLSRLARHYLFWDNVWSRYRRRPSLYLAYETFTDLDVDWVSGACLRLRRKAIDDIIFNEDFFMYGEDLELCWRLKQNGWRVVYTPAATILHHHGASMKQQKDSVLLCSLRGIRSFYTMTHGPTKLWAFDLITLTGFTIRWISYTFLRLIRPHNGYKRKAISSRRMILLSLKTMIGRS